MQSLFKISQQTFWQLIGKITTALSTFLVLGIVTRNYGESGTGIFTLALTYLAIFMQLNDFGFNAHLLTKLHGRNDQLMLDYRKLLGTRLIWSILLIGLAVIMLPFWPFTTPDFIRGVIWGSLAIVGFGIFTSTNLIFQNKLAFERVVVAASIGAFIYLILIFVGVEYGLPLPYLLIAQTIQWLVTAFLALLLIKKFINNWLPIFDLTFARKLIKDSWPIAATLGLNIVYFRADAFMITYFNGEAQVGIYNVAYQVFQTVIILPSLIMNAYFPMLLESLSKKFNTNQQLKLTALSLLCLSILSTMLISFLAPVIIQVLTGGGFTGSVISLRILSLGFPAFFLTSLLITLLIAKNKYRLTLVIYVIGLLFNLIVNFFYIPRGSFYAASWTTIISEYLILILQVVSLIWIL